MKEFEKMILSAKTEADLLDVRRQINDAVNNKKITISDRVTLWSKLRTQSQRLLGSNRRIY